MISSFCLPDTHRVQYLVLHLPKSFPGATLPVTDLPATTHFKRRCHISGPLRQEKRFKHQSLSS